LRVLLNRWVIFLLLLPHLNIYYFTLEEVKPFLVIMNLVMIVIGIPLLIKQFNKLNILILLYTLVILISDAVNGNLTFGVVYTNLGFLAVCIYISFTLRNYRELIKGLYFLLSFAVIINFFTMIIPDRGIALTPNGDAIYFLGGQNALALTIIPSILVVYLYSKIYYHELRLIPVINIMICFLSLVLSGSSTGMIVAFLGILFFIIPKRLLPSFQTYLVMYIFGFFLLVIYRLQEIFFDNLITNVLKEDITLNGRTYIWDYVMTFIKNSWFLGYGTGNEIVNLGFRFLHETHNGFLQILLDTGFLGLGVFLLITFLVGNKLKKVKNHLFSKSVSFALLAYLIVGMTESAFYRKEFWLLLIIGYSLQKIINHYENAVITKKDLMKVA